VTLTCLVPQVLVVNPALAVHSVKELIALARSAPGTISYASSGNGSTGHMAGELFSRQAGVRLLHVPYKGNSRRSRRHRRTGRDDVRPGEHVGPAGEGRQGAPARGSPA